MIARFPDYQGVDENSYTYVTESVLATAFPQNPESRVTKVCDAHFMYLTQENNFDQIKILRRDQKDAAIRKLKKPNSTRSRSNYLRRITFQLCEMNFSGWQTFPVPTL
jgi:hypothetical protein